MIYGKREVHILGDPSHIVQMLGKSNGNMFDGVGKPGSRSLRL
jgi:hypothetical protein